MKPGNRDIRHKVLIAGEELRELQRHTALLVEAFGLDRKIEAYKGTRPITLYRWDLECLMDTIESELNDPREYPDEAAPEYLALKRLAQQLREEYDRHYGDEWGAPNIPIRAARIRPGSSKAWPRESALWSIASLVVTTFDEDAQKHVGGWIELTPTVVGMGSSRDPWATSIRDGIHAIRLLLILMNG
ncbi:hypothetical protein ACYOEI_08560 [Singulisphaera rosea]